MGDDAWLTVESDQVSRYWGRYRQVLVTNENARYLARITSGRAKGAAAAIPFCRAGTICFSLVSVAMPMVEIDRRRGGRARGSTKAWTAVRDVHMVGCSSSVRLLRSA